MKAGLREPGFLAQVHQFVLGETQPFEVMQGCANLIDIVRQVLIGPAPEFVLHDHRCVLFKNDLLHVQLVGVGIHCTGNGLLAEQ